VLAKTAGVAEALVVSRSEALMMSQSALWGMEFSSARGAVSWTHHHSKHILGAILREEASPMEALRVWSCTELHPLLFRTAQGLPWFRIRLEVITDEPFRIRI
jgi:hypothetical protein